MRVLIDTNVLISVALNLDGVPFFFTSAGCISPCAALGRCLHFRGVFLPEVLSAKRTEAHRSIMRS
jgi:hypothetical protein